MYYCKSRYYVPAWCRWLTPDSIDYLDPSSINGLNLYAYCGNDPVNMVDPTGNSAILIGLIIGAIIGFGAASYIDYQDDEQIFNGSVAWYDYLGAIVLGGLIGATYMFVKTSRQSGKVTSSDKPSWVNESMIDPNKTAQQNATDILNWKYGPGNWSKGPGTEYNKIVKWIERWVRYYRGW